MWIPDSFFTALLSGRISSLRDETGAIFIDRDPKVFAAILNYLRTRDVELRSVDVRALRHEAEYYGITPLVKRLVLCQDLTQSSCGDVLFYGCLPPPCKYEQHSPHVSIQLNKTFQPCVLAIPPQEAGGNSQGNAERERAVLGLASSSVRPGNIIRVPEQAAAVPAGPPFPAPASAAPPGAAPPGAAVSVTASAQPSAHVDNSSAGPGPSGPDPNILTNSSNSTSSSNGASTSANQSGQNASSSLTNQTGAALNSQLAPSAYGAVLARPASAATAGNAIRSSSLDLRVASGCAVPGGPSGSGGIASRSSSDLRNLTGRGGGASGGHAPGAHAPGGHSRTASLDMRHARTSSADLNKLMRNEVALVFGSYHQGKVENKNTAWFNLHDLKQPSMTA